MAKLIPSNDVSLSVPSHCDLCGLSILAVFVDGKTAMGPWANMCVYCHRANGCGLGTGKGQRYELQADDYWHKMVPASAPKGKRKPSVRTKGPADPLAKYWQRRPR
jgi:cytochrome c553